MTRTAPRLTAALAALSALGTTIYEQAAANASAHGRAYIDLSAHLLALRGGDDALASALGDVIDPDLRGATGRPVSAVRQLLVAAGHRLDGPYASTVGDILGSTQPNQLSGTGLLFPALAQEMWERAMGVNLQPRADVSFNSTPATPGDPVYTIDQRGLYDQRVQQSRRIVTLDELVSMTVGIGSDGYRSARISADQRGDQYAWGRTSEAADLPLYTIQTSTGEVHVFKYGARVRVPYEALRRMRINQLQLLFNELAEGERRRELRDALEVAANGDGNGNGMDLAGTTPANWSIQNLDEWLMDVANDADLEINRVVADIADVKAIRALRYAAANTQLTPDQLAMYTGEYAMPDGTGLRLAPKNSILSGSKTLLAWNTARALERVVENGSQINETMRFITNQTQEWTMSINVGFAKPFDNSFQAIARQ